MTTENPYQSSNVVESYEATRDSRRYTFAKLVAWVIISSLIGFGIIAFVLLPALPVIQPYAPLILAVAMIGAGLSGAGIFHRLEKSKHCHGRT
mgnify:FL=1